MWNQTQLRRLSLETQKRHLKPMDHAIVMYLSCYIDITSGLVEKRSSEIADDLGLQRPMVYGSLKRLQDRGWLAKGRKGTGYFFMLDPWLCTVGKKHLQAKRQGLYKKLLNDYGQLG